MSIISFKRCSVANFLAFSFFTTNPATANFEKGVQAFINKDFDKARKIFQPLAKQGDAKAQFGLGLLYRNGLGVRKNLNKAFTLYKQSAVQGYAKAQYNLAILTLYLARKNNKFKERDAMAWLKLAAQQDIIRAQYHLGMFYWDGKHGLEIDNVLAYMWVYISASNFFPQAEEKLKLMKKRMKVEEIKQAKQLAVRWRPEASQKVQNPLKQLAQSGHCKTIDHQLSLQLLDIKETAQTLLSCLAKKDFYQDCKPPYIQLTVLYNYHRSSLKQNWWVCQ